MKKLMFLFLILFLCSCASHRGKQYVNIPIKESLQRYSDIEVNISKQENVLMISSDYQRIKVLILNNYRIRKIKINEIQILVLDLKFIKYEKGNALARFMMAGLGQMCIEARLKLIDKKTDKIIGKFEIVKAFWLGGVYGGLVDIQNIELGFVKTIMDILFEENL